MIDSRQNSLGANSPTVPQKFTASLGNWKCVGRNQIAVQIVNINLPEPGSNDEGSYTIADYALSISNNGETVTGTRGFSDYALDTDPNDPHKTPLPGRSFPKYPTSGLKVHLLQKK
ncbi:unnamed protein product [Rotaria sordida]|uniref:Uncharacterized protein n=1 Tax=Rotaria sordida TaxID=392033 RepID=A0A814A9Y4_9BILA|nr:unnamed protein product [Rotaria sordida]